MSDWHDLYAPGKVNVCAASLAYMGSMPIAQPMPKKWTEGAAAREQYVLCCTFSLQLCFVYYIDFSIPINTVSPIAEYHNSPRLSCNCHVSTG
jgi:hypothetical protein